MIKIRVPAGITQQQGAYSIFVGTDLLEKIERLIKIHKYTKSVIITGTNTPTKFVKKIQSSLPFDCGIIALPSGEQHKNIQSVQTIWKKLHGLDANRKSLIINLGGGVIMDVGGFSANTYLKGIDYLNVPTTLLGQVDASIGGKTSIHFDGKKNFIGSFQSPVGVISDINCLITLPKRQFISGFGEIIKHGLIADAKYFHFATSKKPEQFTKIELTKLVERSCEIKMRVIHDIKEENTGKVLRFGHTIGHAIELLYQHSSHPLLHGEAVLVGIIVETNVSHLLGFLTKDERDKIVRSVQVIYNAQFVSSISIPAFTRILHSNTYPEGDLIPITLLKNIGHAVIDQKVSINVIVEAIQQTKEVQL